MWPFPARLKPTPAAGALVGEASGDEPRLTIYQSELTRLVELTRQYPAIETGGDLFGYWSHTGWPVVSLVIGPGSRSRHHVTSFYQDAEYLNDVGVRLYDTHGLQHVGEWHSHHRLGLNEPSGGDLRTVRRGMATKRWSRFLLLIATLDRDKTETVVLNFYLLRAPSDAPIPLRIIVLPGQSPFHAELDGVTSEPVQRPVGDSVWRPGPHTPPEEVKAAEAFPTAWFTQPEGQQRIKAIVGKILAHPVPCRILVVDEGRSLVLALPDGDLTLPDGFPATVPRWQPTGGIAADVPSWTLESDLARWYLEQSTARKGVDREEIHADQTGTGAADARPEVPPVSDPGRQ